MRNVAIPQFAAATRTAGPRKPTRTRRPGNFDPKDINAQTQQAAEGLRAGTEGFARGAQINFGRDVGALLGNLNALGGIRTGGIKTGVQEIGRQYGEQIGIQAAQTAVEAGRQGAQRAQFVQADETQRYGIDTSAATSRYGTDVGASVQREGFAQRGREFDQDLGFRRDQSTVQQSQFDRNFAQSGSQFDRNFEQRGSQFDRDFAQRGSQFDRDLGFRQTTSDRDFGESGRRFDAMTAQERARYNEEMAYSRRLDQTNMSDAKRRRFDRTAPGYTPPPQRRPHPEDY